ncbi:MAG TPA: NAD(P)-binding domain-containing protein [Usitatibacter sp.]|jgi:4-hydroxybutyrate dehydrogenase/sulfolactaldehyde 3-reductase|nr:NAD(P)-binding domain-containing protein [Usitatibacter sp.]
MKVAFLGLGTMGAPMARNLVKAGHELAAYDVVAKAMEAFRGPGSRAARSPRDAAEGADIVITMLPDSSHVREALLGPEGACRSLAKGKLVIDMSTIAASASVALGEELAAQGFRSIDAPVGRTPRDAAAGTLLIIAGGAPGDIAEARPLFERLGDSIVHAGPRGHGIKLKLVNNYMSTVGTVLTAEALTLANKAGLDRDITVKVLSGTTAGRGQLLVNYPRKVLAGDLTPDFPIRMAHKDVSHALGLGAELGSPLLLGAIARELFALAKPWARADEDWTAMLLLLEDLSRAPHVPPSSNP